MGMGMQIVQVRCGPSIDVCNAHSWPCVLDVMEVVVTMGEGRAVRSTQGKGCE